MLWLKILEWIAVKVAAHLAKSGNTVALVDNTDRKVVRDDESDECEML